MTNFDLFYAETYFQAIITTFNGSSKWRLLNYDENSKQIEFIIHKSLSSSNLCVDYEGCDIFLSFGLYQVSYICFRLK